ncbi:MAG: ATP-dependent DNA ligase [Acidimicrobiales bacterium]
MLLRRLADTSVAVAATSSRKEKSELLAAVIADLANDEIEAAVGFLTGSVRQGAIGVGWATISKVAVEPATRPTLEVCDLDELLTEIAATTGTGSEAKRGALLADFLGNATEVEHEFVRRVLIGDLRQGALAGVVTDAVAKAAGVTQKLMRRAVMLQGDLGASAVVALIEGTEGLTAIDLEVGRPIQPMLASTAADAGEAVESVGEAQVEWKLDGARIQVHRDGDDVAIYTRNLNNVTGRLAHIVETVRSFDCSSAVLDGEVLGFFDVDSADHDSADHHGADHDSADHDGADARGADHDGADHHGADHHGADHDGADHDGADGGLKPQPFQDTMSVFGTETDHTPTSSEEPHHRLRPFFFDLMYLDGASLIDRPLVDRSELLGGLVGNRQIPRIVTDSPIEAADMLAKALDAGHEGVMVKGVDSRYEAGRRGKSWRKVKPVHTLDLVILAAEWGHGRRTGWLSNLHLGARDPAGDGFVMVGKTFKGLTDELLQWQTERFLELKTGESKNGFVVHIAPEVVVEIALDGAQKSPRYPGGVALRFARVKGYRPDKDPATADTINAVRGLL